MNAIPFHDLGDEDGHFYALGCCECQYVPRDAGIPAMLVLYFSPSEAFSRFSLQVFGGDAQRLLYHRGPDYSAAVEAAILDAWVALSVPAYVWKLYPRDKIGAFVAAEHERRYYDARRELSLALYGLRMKAWADHDMKARPLVQPPHGGFKPVDAFAPALDNEELLQAAVDSPSY